jgi:hypothetical protein
MEVKRYTPLELMEADDSIYKQKFVSESDYQDLGLKLDIMENDYSKLRDAVIYAINHSPIVNNAGLFKTLKDTIKKIDLKKIAKENFKKNKTTSEKLDDFLNSLPPTCTHVERRFLDELREIGTVEFHNSSMPDIFLGYDSTIYSEYFPDIDLSQLIWKTESDIVKDENKKDVMEEIKSLLPALDPETLENFPKLKKMKEAMK